MDTPTCAICRDDVIDHPAPHATGSHRSSCGHVFHPSCIVKWQLSQDKSTCPMCRHNAGEMEDCTSRTGGDVIRISRAGLDYIMRQAGGIGMTAGVEAEVQIDEFNVVTIERSQLGRIVQVQGGKPLSDAQWTQLISVYPPAEANDDEDDEGRTGGAPAFRSQWLAVAAGWAAMAAGWEAYR